MTTPLKVRFRITHPNGEDITHTPLDDVAPGDRLLVRDFRTALAAYNRMVTQLHNDGHDVAIEIRDDGQISTTVDGEKL
jgi:hypothetical protein